MDSTLFAAVLAPTAQHTSTASLSEIVTLVSTSAAALAAIAAWVAVLQASRAQRRSLEPWLYIHGSREIGPTSDGLPDYFRLRVENARSGLATGIFIWANIKGSRRAYWRALPPTATLAGGQGTTLRADDLVTGTPRDALINAVVMWRQGDRLVAQAGGLTKSKSWKIKKNNKMTREDVVHHFFPETGDIWGYEMVVPDVTSD